MAARAKRVDLQDVSWLSRHLLAAVIVCIAAASVGAVFAFARPTYHPYVMPAPPNDLPYTTVSYTAADAIRAFSAAGIKLVRRGPHATRSYPMTGLSNNSLIVEVTAFGDPQNVKDSGFSTYFTFVDGHWVKAPRTCAPGAIDAERWRGNVRVIVSCTRAGADSGMWLRRAQLALGRL
jgi:hypothetical protein